MSGTRCGHCGVENHANADFCVNCDAFLGWSGPSESSDSCFPEHPDPVVPAPPMTVDTILPPHPPAEFGTLLNRTATICPICATENGPERQFCRRCGEWTATPPPAVAQRPVPFREQLRRRLQARNPYTRTLSSVTVVFRTIAGTLVVAVSVALLTLTGQHPIRQATDWVGHVRGAGRLSTAAAELTAQTTPPGISPIPKADWAIDDIRNHGWTIPWSEQTAKADDSTCATPHAEAAATSLIINFATAQDIREIGFQAGYTTKDQRTDRWQPRVVELRWLNGGCESVELENTADLQRFGIHQDRHVGGVRISIVNAYAPTETGPARITLGEVIFWHR